MGVFYDTGHTSLVGERLPLGLDIAWEYIELFALKDVVWQTEAGHQANERTMAVVPMGYGLVEWGVFVRELKRRAFDGTLSFHCEYSGYPPESVLDQAAVDVRVFRSLWESDN